MSLSQGVEALAEEGLQRGAEAREKFAGVQFSVFRKRRPVSPHPSIGLQLFPFALLAPFAAKISRASAPLKTLLG
ncbi:hypothetical protein [Luteolibacter sp. LG18]|uniref:hypothetical protein n=1 Tax=Luteolibacter sp. LG18 TaxID=2819286 RepID=UPI0030C77993